MKIKHLAVTLLAIGLLPLSVLAQTDIYIRGSSKLFPIALPQLCAGEGASDAAKDIPKILARDLDLSGYFEVVNPSAYIETPGKCGAPEDVAYSDWTVIGAEGLVKGIIRSYGDSIKAQLYLHDVARQKIVLGKEYEGTMDQVPLIAHKFANEIMKFFTGEAGVFGTKIAYSSKVGRFKEIFVMDMDGGNVRQLTNEKSLSMSAAWDSDGEGLFFTSYLKRQPDLFFLNIFDKRIKQLTRDSALEVGVKPSPDGSRLALSRTVDRDSSIILLEPGGSLIRTLLPANGSINVSPSWSPDGARLAFCSNRSGGPQIFTMNSDGSEIKRISFLNSNYCTSPAWSPKGDKIAFVCRFEGGFQLFTANPDGSDLLQLTSTGSNEDPDWAPNGQFIVFSTTFWQRGVPSLALMRPDGSNLKRLSDGRAGDVDPAWGPLIN